MSLGGSNLNFFIIPVHHFLIALNKLHIYGNYMTSSYKWHLSEGENYNEVVLINTFLKFRPCLTVTCRNFVLTWWLSGIGTRRAWIQLCVFVTQDTSLQLHCLSRENGRGSWLCVWGPLLRSVPHWNGTSSGLLESTHGHWMADSESISPRFFALLGLGHEEKGQEIVFRVLHLELCLHHFGHADLHFNL